MRTIIAPIGVDPADAAPPVVRGGERLLGLALYVAAAVVALVAFGLYLGVGDLLPTTPCAHGSFDPNLSDWQAPVVLDGTSDVDPGQAIRLAKGCRPWAEMIITVSSVADEVTEARIHFEALMEGDREDEGRLRFGSDDFRVCVHESTSGTRCAGDPPSRAPGALRVDLRSSFADRVAMGTAADELLVIEAANADTLTIEYRPILRFPPDYQGADCRDPFSFCALFPNRWLPATSSVFVMTVPLPASASTAPGS